MHYTRVYYWVSSWWANRIGLASLNSLTRTANDELKTKLYNSSPLSFFRDIALPSSNFPKYIAHVQRIVAMFGGTYCCEQLFSKVKYTKFRLRSLLSDRHLNNIILLSSSSIKPDIEILQHQPPHSFACFAIKVL